MRTINVLIVLSVGGLFVLDLVVPLGIACTAPYAAVIALCLWLPDRRYIIVTSAIVSVLIVAGLFLSPPGAPVWKGVLNRSFSLAAVWAVAFVVLRRKELIARMRVDQRRLRHIQKLEVIGRLAGGIAHDLNNIMTVVVGYTEFIADKLEKDHPVREDLNEVRKASQRCTSLTRQLLSFCRRGALAPKPQDLGLILADMETLLRRLVGEDVEWVLNSDPNLGKIEADQGQLEQIILNLVLNARDAMPAGGTLRIEVANVPPGESPHRRAPAPDGPLVMLAVNDTGSGIDREIIGRIFEPLFTTKPARQGTGLGLATVRSIVKGLGGDIAVESDPATGSTFRVYFPRLEGPIGPEPELPVSTGSAVEAASTVILLVEDDAGIRSLAERVLRERGYTVVTASDGGEAVRIAESRASAIHLLLTDVVLPGISGPQVAQQLTAVNRALRVLYISAYPYETLARRGLRLTEVEILQKPFTAQALTQKVREVLESNSSNEVHK